MHISRLMRGAIAQHFNTATQQQQEQGQRSAAGVLQSPTLASSHDSSPIVPLPTGDELSGLSTRRSQPTERASIEPPRRGRGSRQRFPGEPANKRIRQAVRESFLGSDSECPWSGSSPSAPGTPFPSWRLRLRAAPGSTGPSARHWPRPAGPAHGPNQTETMSVAGSETSRGDGDRAGAARHGFIKRGPAENLIGRD